MAPYEDCFHFRPDGHHVPSPRPHDQPHDHPHHHPHHPPPPPHRPCHQRGPYSQAYYKYTAIAVTSCGITALLIIMWIYCRRRGGGRVVAPPPPPPEPVKLSPPPYSPEEYQNPPSYNDCVPNIDHRQQFACGSQCVEVSGLASGVHATAPPNFSPRPPPLPTHVVDMPAFSKEGPPRY